MSEKTETLAADILIGAEQIAAFTGLNLRQVYHQATNLKLKRLGGHLIGSKKRLREVLAGEVEAA
jgi:hypothetical protein